MEIEKTADLEPAALPAISTTFLARLSKVNGRRPLTVSGYRRDLARFFCFLACRGIPYDGVKRLDIEEYTESLSKTMGARAMNRPLSAIRTFYRWLHRTERFPNNIRDWVEAPKFEPNIPEPLTEKEMRHILNVAEQNPLKKDWVHRMQDLSILYLLYSCAVRLEEISCLTLNDFDFEQNEIVIRLGKGGKKRTVDFDNRTGFMVRRLVSYAARNAHAPLIQNPRGKYSHDAVRAYIGRIVKVYARLAGVKKRIHPHLFRHTAATHMLLNGSDLKAIGNMLGHKHLSATEIYVHMTGEHRKKQYRAFHPLGKANAN